MNSGTHRFPLKSKLPNIAIGVMGSAGGELHGRARDSLYKLGAEIARKGCTLFTGVAPGLPHDAVLGANSEQGLVVGISPALNFEEHVERYKSPTHGYDVIIYTGSGFMGREIENIRSCDIVVIAGGRSGTLGEFAIAYDEAKIIGVLTGTGGIADHIDELMRVIEKDTGAIVVSDDDPIRLIDSLIDEYETTVLPRHQKLLEQSNPDGILE